MGPIAGIAHEMEPAAAVTYCPILQSHHSKTIDIGLNGHTLSAGPRGDILQLSCFHPRHGMVVASPFPQFDGSRFHDPQYVRDYRARMLKYVRSGTHGFGIRFEGSANNLNINFVNNQWPLITYDIGCFHVSTTLVINSDAEAIQTTRVTSGATTTIELPYVLELNVSINRASYGQLTEGGPIPIPPPRNDLQILNGGHNWAVVNSNLEAILGGSLSCNGVPISFAHDISPTVVGGQPLKSNLPGSKQLLPGQSCTLVATFHLRPGTTSSFEKVQPSSRVPDSRGQWRLGNDEMGLIIKRNLEYVLGNCTIPVGNGNVCFITDHVALPLGWNRDNYWQIRFLLDVYQNLDRIAYIETARAYAMQIRTSIRGHLNWVFRLAQRPHGYWHRSYLTTGVPKDGPVFQQDQQCYPLLEICDFYDAFPSESGFVKEILTEKTIPDILAMLKARKDPQTGLYATEETPGDDAVEYPFHFSSHVLLWYTITRLSSLVKTIPINPSLCHSQLRNLANQIRESTLRHFIAKNSITETTMFAYLTDGKGQHTFYHDANDIPTLFIPDWSFSTSQSDLDTWSRTMDFGISPQNDGGFYPSGPYGGLGSVHTRGPWPLGYAQEFVYAHVKGNEGKREDAWRRIKGCMFWDGLFSEAVDKDTGDCVSKAWFSWPGCMIGSALLRCSLPEPGTRALI